MSNKKPQKQKEPIDFRAALVALRQELGLSQHRLAQRLNLTIGAVAKWETTSMRPSTEAMSRLIELAYRARRPDLGEVFIREESRPDTGSGDPLPAGWDLLGDFDEAALTAQARDAHAMNHIGQFVQAYMEYEDVRKPILAWLAASRALLKAVQERSNDLEHRNWSMVLADEIDRIERGLYVSKGK